MLAQELINKVIPSPIKSYLSCIGLSLGVLAGLCTGLCLDQYRLENKLLLREVQAHYSLPDSLRARDRNLNGILEETELTDILNNYTFVSKSPN
ncbi:MAG: hypothetical protein AABX11_05365 [Nanoarchaeota archaeon]